ncbi:type III polyketide synthase [Streptomyces sp. YIM 98790]|uniref:type III polyketide synthase n=1 Tax=Streptomyces sp. YIM 98790 TaxID=2689077 RepID=UPI00140A4019|nr:type III polyketide synthase [Streptomyces sp. YIM 98790]
MVTAVLTGVGTALPPPVHQDALWDGFFRHHFGGSRIARRVFHNTGVRRRHTAVSPLTEPATHWSTADRMLRYAREAPELGHRAVAAALRAAGRAADEIGLLTVASCTGYDTPGLDIRLAGSLGLPADARRLLVGHMGCYAALPALGSAADFVTARRRPAVVLCLELPSLHLQPPTDDPQQVVVHALFGDAAAAVVLEPAGPGPAQPPPGRRALELVDLAAHTDPATSALMTWRITDLGFRMGLSPEVPDILAKHVRPVTEELLTRHRLKPADVAGWAVHPGGPLILDTVQDELGLPPAALAPSRTVLREHGNCSSPTVLLVLRDLLAGGALPDGAPVVALAFGPGLTLCAALLRATRSG